MQIDAMTMFILITLNTSEVSRFSAKFILVNRNSESQQEERTEEEILRSPPFAMLGASTCSLRMTRGIAKRHLNWTSGWKDSGRGDLNL